jgi:hypothetical protein
MSDQGWRDMANDASDGAFVAPRATEGGGITFAVLHAHRPYGLDCKCGRPINSDNDWARHVDQAIVKALGLTEERHTAPEYETKAVRGGTGVFRYGGQTSRYVGNGTRRRFVTPWEADA